jgi:hypothetical protein
MKTQEGDWMSGFETSVGVDIVDLYTYTQEYEQSYEALFSLQNRFRV